MKKILSILLLTAMLLSLAACSGNADKQTEAPAKEETTAAAPQTEEIAETEAAPSAEQVEICAIMCANTEYNVWLDAEIKKQCTAAGYDYTLLDHKDDQETQVQLIQDAINQGYDYILLVPLQGDISDIILEGTKAGSKFIFFNTAQDWATGVALQVMCDQYYLGYAIAEDAAKKIPENGTVLFVEGRAGGFSATERRPGFVDGLLNARPDVTLLDDQFCNWSREEAMSTMDDWLQLYDKIDCVLAQSDSMAMGVYDSFISNGIDPSNTLIYGIDGLPLGCEGIVNGALEGSATQSAEQFAKIMVNDYITPDVKGELNLLDYVSETVEFGSELVTSSQAAERLEYFKELGMYD